MSATLVRETLRADLRRLVFAFASLIIGITGCTTISQPAGTAPLPDSSLTGNWEFVTEATQGAIPFQSFAGFIDEHDDASGADDSAVASFQIADPTTCYLGATLIPMQGSVKGMVLGLYSFTVVGQYFSITATKNVTSTHLTGTYSIGGGCASSNMGTVNGTKYTPLAGTFEGQLGTGSASESLSLKTSQSNQSNGDGTFNLSGSAFFTGSPCFTQGTLSSAESMVLGSSVRITLLTNEPSGSQVTLVGKSDPAGSQIIITSAVVSGGNCSGSLAGATLFKQT